MKIEHTEIFGFRAAFRGMRNPFDSWDKSDSAFESLKPGSVPQVDILGRETRKIFELEDEDYDVWAGKNYSAVAPEIPYIGQEDIKLACKLIAFGGDHRKFLRMITVWADLTIPRYAWQEVDTYKVGTVRNSCSTMNMLGKRKLNQDDFEGTIPEYILSVLDLACENFKNAGNDATAKNEARIALKNVLPEGYLQKATYLLNYEVGLRMYFSRRHHRLPMWRADCEGSLCSWIKSWPYMTEFISAAEGDRGVYL